jgi:hypothetical protein
MTSPSKVLDPGIRAVPCPGVWKFGQRAGLASWIMHPASHLLVQDAASAASAAPGLVIVQEDLADSSKSYFG